MARSRWSVLRTRPPSSVPADSMLATADRVGFGRRLVEVVLLVVAPVLFPAAWIVGAVLLLSRRGAGRWSLVTVALCPAGLLPPLWFYGAGTDPATLAPQ